MVADAARDYVSLSLVEGWVQQDFRITVLVWSGMSLAGRFGFSIRCSMVTIARAPMSAQL
jgi:hypothetical protein